MFLLLSLFTTTLNLTANEGRGDSHKSYGGAYIIIAAIVFLEHVGGIGYFIYNKHLKPSTNITEPIQNTAKTITPKFSVNDINAKITGLMTDIYENLNNNISAFDLVQKLKEASIRKEYSPAALKVLEETLSNRPDLTTYADALEHLNKLTKDLPETELPTTFQAISPTELLKQNQHVSTAEKINVLKNDMFSKLTQEDGKSYARTLELIANKPNDSYSDKILDALLECLTSGQDNTTLTLAKYNNCEHAAQVQHAATNS
ncbi:hypothetical protein EKK58_03745 [Candidatus Dependentiae bacterium]|nr:MAG: hypothetical protein EKK58_03745 [Candidatus Dependentiae bacterium]